MPMACNEVFHRPRTAPDIEVPPALTLQRPSTPYQPNHETFDHQRAIDHAGHIIGILRNQLDPAAPALETFRRHMLRYQRLTGALRNSHNHRMQLQSLIFSIIS